MSANVAQDLSDSIKEFNELYAQYQSDSNPAVRNLCDKAKDKLKEISEAIETLDDKIDIGKRKLNDIVGPCISGIFYMANDSGYDISILQCMLAMGIDIDIIKNDMQQFKNNPSMLQDAESNIEVFGKWKGANSSSVTSQASKELIEINNAHGEVEKKVREFKDILDKWKQVLQSGK